ncbi:MAG: hypothetical protein MUE68_07885 [Bacteroidetes bacterium]|nr:hypothetical protein [Bacteroidota bacterium]
MGLNGSATTVEYRYRFDFGDGTVKDFRVVLDALTYAYREPVPVEPPEWTRLEYSKCSNCPLQGAERCPVAMNLSVITREFEETKSFTDATVTVTSPERTYQKATTVQRGLSAITGIIMVTSGCPIMDRLRPNVAFHLPFATPMETSYRSVAMYLTAQAIRKMNGEVPDWEMHGLMAIYEDVAKVNKGIAQRLRDASGTDSGANAVVILHAFGDFVSIMIETRLQEFEAIFSALTQPPSSGA